MRPFWRHIYLSPIRPNSVLKIGFDPVPRRRRILGSRMSRIWLALFCLIGLGPAIAIMVAAPASLVVERAQHQEQMNPAFALNDSAKSDRLELPNGRAETDVIVPATKLMPADTPSTSPEAVKKVDDGHWQMPTLRPCRHRLAGILRLKDRCKVQENIRRTKEPRPGTADRTPWAVF
jgi:hypothetical protein